MGLYQRVLFAGDEEIEWLLKVQMIIGAPALIVLMRPLVGSTRWGRGNDALRPAVVALGVAGNFELHTAGASPFMRSFIILRLLLMTQTHPAVRTRGEIGSVHHSVIAFVCRW